MAFPNLWRCWVKGILESARASVLLNGSPSWEFQCFRGVRQGDPLSPFLFIIAMEALTCLATKAESIGLIKGIQLPNIGPSFSHLMYADDVVVLGEWNEGYIRNVIRLFHCFYLISGLKLNLHKSNLYGIGLSDNSLSAMASNIGVKEGAFPCKYLGVLVGANMNQCRHWKDVIEVCRARLSKWKTKTLSSGGRLVLLKSVLDCLPLYYFSIFKAPKRIIKELERLRKRFFWGGNDDKQKMVWIYWERVIGPTDKGGVGLGALQDMNLSLLVKWWWRYKNELDTLWSRTISAIHGSARSWSYLPIKSSVTGVWNAIFKINKELTDQNFNIDGLIIGGLGDNKSIRFWIDTWLCNEPLSAQFPDLFVLKTDKKCTIAERLQRVRNLWVGNWDWKHEPVQQQEQVELPVMTDLVQGAAISDNKDIWKWKLEADGIFSVASCRKLLSQSTIPFYPYQWSKWVRRKVNIMAWRAEQDRLPTLAGLARRNIINTLPTCRLCDDGVETASHIFTECFYAANIWNKVSEWVKIQQIFAFDFRDLLNVHKTNGLGRVKKKAVHSVILTTCWII